MTTHAEGTDSAADATLDNIVDIAAGSDAFGLLVRALDAAGLTETVRGLDDVTVFAPTDAAFAALAADLGYEGDPADEEAVFDAIVAALTDLGGGDPIPLLTDVLLYHVSEGAKSADDVAGQGTLAILLEGAQIAPFGTTLRDAEPDLADPQIAMAGIEASNGIIHALDRVLLPLDVPGNTPEDAPTITGLVAESGGEFDADGTDFDILLNAVQTAELADTLDDPEADLTVFAPTDAAFAALAADLGYEGDPADEEAVFDAIVAALTDLGGGDPIPLLTDVLLYHVSPGAQTALEIAGSDSVATLLEDASLTPDGATLGDAEPDLADPEIAVSDIVAANGIVQALDRVLLPLDIPGNEGPPTLAGIVAASGGEFDDDGTDFDLLLNAAQTAGLVEALDDPGASLTVFAPDDAAFLSLAQTLGFEGDGEGAAFGYVVDALTLLSGGGDPTPLLTDILTYHVAPEALDADAVLGSETIGTLLGAELGVDGTTLVDADPDLPDPSIIATDIEAANGIAHVLDGVLIPADILQSDGSDDVDFIIGDDTDETFVTGPDADLVSGKAGDDVFEGGAGDDLFVGGAGVDSSLVDGPSAHYALTLGMDGITVDDRRDDGTGTDTLVDVERLTFSDGASFGAEGAFDLSLISGVAGLDEGQLTSVVELYVAYFDRAPDALGLSYWGTRLAEGMTLGEIATSFSVQPEAEMRLPEDGDHGALVDAAYANLFEREADAAGRDYWIDALAAGDVNAPELMLALINGAKAETGSPADAQVVADKADIGLAYAAIAGLNDVDDAVEALAGYDRDDRADSLEAADALIADFAAAATSGADEALTVTLAGIADDPFAV